MVKIYQNGAWRVRVLYIGRLRKRHVNVCIRPEPDSTRFKSTKEAKRQARAGAHQCEGNLMRLRWGFPSPGNQIRVWPIRILPPLSGYRAWLHLGCLCIFENSKLYWSRIVKDYCHPETKSEAGRGKQKKIEGQERRNGDKKNTNSQVASLLLTTRLAIGWPISVFTLWLHSP